MRRNVTAQMARKLRRKPSGIEAHLQRAIDIVDPWGGFDVLGVDISQGLYMAIWAILCDGNRAAGFFSNFPGLFLSVLRNFLKSFSIGKPAGFGCREILVLVPGKNANIIQMTRPVIDELGPHRVAVVADTDETASHYLSAGGSGLQVNLKHAFGIGPLKALFLLFRIVFKTAAVTWKSPAGDRKWAGIIIREAFYLGILAYQLNERLDMLSPQVIITTSDAAMADGLLIELASLKGIRSVVLQHGFPVFNTFFWRPIEDAFCAYGELDRQMALRMGLEPSQIHITGSPGFDSPRLCDKKALSDKLGMKPDVMCVLVVTNNEAGVREYLVKTLCCILHELPGVQFWFRLHPMEQITDYDRLLPSGLSERIRFFDNTQFSVDQMCCVAECVVGVTTTFLVHAILRYKPCIMLTPPGKVLGIFQSMVDEKMLTHATDKNQLLNALRTRLYDNGKQHTDMSDTAQRLVASTGSDSAKKIAAVVESLL